MIRKEAVIPLLQRKKLIDKKDKRLSKSQQCDLFEFNPSHPLITLII